MKNVQKLFSMAMLMCMAITMFSCSKDEEETIFAEADIVGNWEITSSDYLVNGASFESGEGFTVGYEEGTEFSIMDDKSYTIASEEYTYEEGNWTFEGKNTITIVDSNKETKKYEVRSLSKESATFYSSSVDNSLGVEIKSEETLKLKK